MSYWTCTFCGEHYPDTEVSYDSLEEWKHDHDYEVEEIHE